MNINSNGKSRLRDLARHLAVVLSIAAFAAPSFLSVGAETQAGWKTAIPDNLAADVELTSHMLSEWIEPLLIFRLPLRVPEWNEGKIVSSDELSKYVERRGITPDEFDLLNTFFVSIDHQINIPEEKVTEHAEFPFRHQTYSATEEVHKDPSVEWFGTGFRVHFPEETAPLQPTEAAFETRFKQETNYIVTKKLIFFRNPTAKEQPRTFHVPPGKVNLLYRTGWANHVAEEKYIPVVLEDPSITFASIKNSVGTINTPSFGLINFPTSTTKANVIESDRSTGNIPWVPIPVQMVVIQEKNKLLEALGEYNPAAAETAGKYSFDFGFLGNSSGDPNGVLFLNTSLTKRKIRFSPFLLRAIFFDILRKNPPPFKIQQVRLKDDSVGPPTFGGFIVSGPDSHFFGAATESQQRAANEKLYLRVGALQPNDAPLSHPNVLVWEEAQARAGWCHQVYDQFIDAIRFPIAHELGHVVNANGNVLGDCTNADKTATELLGKAYNKISLGAFEDLLVSAINEDSSEPWGSPNVGELRARYAILTKIRAEFDNNHK